MTFGAGYLWLWVFFAVVGMAVLGGIIALVAAISRREIKNNRAPVKETHVTVVSKRVDSARQQQPIAGDTSGAHGFQTMTFSTYHVRFHSDAGEPIELTVSQGVYAILHEGDSGMLTYQGTRLIGWGKNEREERA